MSEWSYKEEVSTSEAEILRENDVLLAHQRELAKIAADKEVALYKAKMAARSQRNDNIITFFSLLLVFVFMALVVGAVILSILSK